MFLGEGGGRRDSVLKNFSENRGVRRKGNTFLVLIFNYDKWEKKGWGQFILKHLSFTRWGF